MRTPFPKQRLFSIGNAVWVARREEVLNDARQILLDEYRNAVPARSGAAELVRRLSGEGVKLAIASSSPIDFLRRAWRERDIRPIRCGCLCGRRGQNEDRPPVQRECRFQAGGKTR